MSLDLVRETCHQDGWLKVVISVNSKFIDTLESVVPNKEFSKFLGAILEYGAIL
jgi:hypothetical protein